ncbi:MAG: hypothetical protein QOJ17_5836 [Rhodospirillaceae bacterium]|jgi:hypothetical protein|nr:hypothetical protein [Rhodospirillaceae bacterium]
MEMRTRPRACLTFWAAQARDLDLVEESGAKQTLNRPPSASSIYETTPYSGYELESRPTAKR